MRSQEVLVRHGINDTSNKIKLNLFTQLSEPTIKEGIWLQINESYSKIVIDDTAYSSGEWIDPTSDIYPSDLPSTIGDVTSAAIISHGDYIYVIGGHISGGNRKTFHRLNTRSNLWEQLPDIPHYYTARLGTAVHGDYIYTFGGSYSAFGSSGYSYGNNSYKYDTINGVWSTIKGYPQSTDQIYATTFQNFIYCFGGAVSTSTPSRMIQNAYKYDIILNNYQSLSQIPSSLPYRIAVPEGSNKMVYLMNNNNQSYIYDIINDTYTNNTINFPPTAFYMEGIINEDIYYYSSNTNRLDGAGFYKYDPSTNTHTLLDSPPNNRYNTSPYSPSHFMEHNNWLYVLGIYDGSSSMTMRVYSLVSSVYDNKTFVIIKNLESEGIYYTEFVSLPNIQNLGIITRMTTGFNNAFIYTDDKLKSPPAYYGNGVEWIKFKN